ncbi:helix-turn-helix domain-containing protein [Mesonia aestuariivivens]|uniref:Helix-turn-helix domain-containing protein n=1 Tax=Mesonia aestuariivivens TaxID=2796128 RepID=A0ABS6W2D7_9FLAO|nr:helix-turn-helix domain-containing protein [Mesonia aestuariivivens]MBW2961303.1 helix-turn-helix domain-containing protein [Mesonia aestuariivivens]
MEVLTEKQRIEESIKAHAIYDANNKSMTAKECAEYLGVHINTVKNKINSGEIKANLIGTVWSIPKIQFLKKIIEDKWKYKKSHR